MKFLVCRLTQLLLNCTCSFQLFQDCRIRNWVCGKKLRCRRGRFCTYCTIKVIGSLLQMHQSCAGTMTFLFMTRFIPYSGHTSKTVITQIHQIKKCEDSQIRVVTGSVQQQSNRADCGSFEKAFATDVAFANIVKSKNYDVAVQSSPIQSYVLVKEK